jgi:hypothetical protein
MGQLKTEIEADGVAEQASYDKFACWCEETLSKKAGDITAGKESIEHLQSLIIQLKGQIGVHSVEVVQLKKDIAANLASQKEASGLRHSESTEYAEEKAQSEQCIGALEAAVNTLAAAGGHKVSGIQQARLLSVAGGVRGVLNRAASSMNEDDVQVVRSFVEHPEEFEGGQTAFLSASHTKNPYGDYAPASTKIQGVLKGMYDSFTGDLERANAEEATKQKSFEALMDTKRSELSTLQATLQRQSSDEAEKTKTTAESRTALDDAKKQLDADEVFFADSKTSCKAKAGAWAQRTRLRTEELQGIAKAEQILNENKDIFANATTTFLQLPGAKADGKAKNQKKAYLKLKALATKYKNINLARLASSVRSGGHFDAIISSIDMLVKTMREEEQDDIKHRDRCQTSMSKNKMSMEDLEYSIDKAGKELTRLDSEAKGLGTKITALHADVDATTADMKSLLEMRNKEHGDFVAAVKADTDAVAALGQAVVALSEFYKRNKIPMALAQKKEEPQYADAAPETSWKSGAKEGQSGGIIAILSMIKEDLEKETKVARQDDIDNQRNYEKDRKAMNDMLHSQKVSLSSLETEEADLQMKIADLKEFQGLTGKDLDSEKEEETALDTDCSWVESHFESRRDKRKTEMDGLVEAKNYLAGVDSGDSLEMDD